MIATTYEPVRPTTAPEAPERRPHRGWFRGRRTPLHHDRPAELLAVLERARAIVEAGWVQNRWCVEPAAQGKTVWVEFDRSDPDEPPDG